MDLATALLAVMATETDLVLALLQAAEIFLDAVSALGMALVLVLLPALDIAAEMMGSSFSHDGAKAAAFHYTGAYLSPDELLALIDHIRILEKEKKEAGK